VFLLDAKKKVQNEEQLIALLCQDKIKFWSDAALPLIIYSEISYFIAQEAKHTKKIQCPK